MSAVLGHSHPAIVEVVGSTIGRLDHLFSGMLSRPVIDLAEALGVARAGAGQGAAADHGRGVERGGAADGPARHRRLGGRGLQPVLARDDRRRGVGDLLGGAARLRSGERRLDGDPGARTPTGRASRRRDGTLDWRTELDDGFDLVDRQSAGGLAAFIAEPILSSGGIIELPPGYLTALRAKCAERGMLLVLDEAQTGIGRTGTMFAYERDGATPDLLTLSKTLGAGLPLAAVLTTTEIEQQAPRARLPLLHDPRERPAARGGRARRPRRGRPGAARRARARRRRAAAGGAARACGAARVHRRRPRPRPARSGSRSSPTGCRRSRRRRSGTP